MILASVRSRQCWFISSGQGGGEGCAQVCIGVVSGVVGFVPTGRNERMQLSKRSLQDLRPASHHIRLLPLIQLGELEVANLFEALVLGPGREKSAVVH
jgi:Na+-transporting NADH:ubiquinone oxidoreductase subunit NqrF